jgi:hypothetical protein
MINGKMTERVYRRAQRPSYGWHPTVMTAPQQAVTFQQRAEEIARELREQYDLKE